MNNSKIDVGAFIIANSFPAEDTHSFIELDCMSVDKVRELAQQYQAEIDRRDAEIATMRGDQKDIVTDTGHPEADRLIGRLCSADPDFQDCVDASILIRRLVVDHKGPDGFATWQDAAVAERLGRVAVQSELETLKAALSASAGVKDDQP